MLNRFAFTRFARVCALMVVGAVALCQASPASAALITIQPGTVAGYLPLTLFGTQPTPVSADGGIAVNVPAFTFGGEIWSALTMGENGVVMLGSGVTDAEIGATNQSLPNGTGPHPILAPFWTDLSGGALRLEVLTDGVSSWLVLDWADMLMDGGQRTNFQVWIGVNAVEDIVYAYDPRSLPALPINGRLTVGAQDPTGRVGTNFYYNGTGTSLTEDLRISTDGLPVTPVPEPATLSLLGAGLAFSAIARRRRAS